MGVLAPGGVTRLSAQNRDWPFPEWDSTGGSKADPALPPLTVGGPGSPGGEWEREQAFRAPEGLRARLGDDRQGQ